MAVLIDTSAFYALADTTDAFYEKARYFYSEAAGKLELVTTDYIFIESWMLINYKLGRKAAVTFWENMISGMIPIIGVQGDDLYKAWKIVQDYNDQDFNVVDCTTFALMERMDITEAFTFDKHFHVYRYGRDKRGYFKVIPSHSG